MNNKDHTAKFRLAKKDWDEFKDLCEKVGEKPSKLIREFVKRWVKKKS